MDKEMKLQDGFAQELAFYKQLLWQLRSGLGLKTQVLSDAAGIGNTSYYQLENIPWTGTHRVRTTLPQKKVHESFIETLRQADAGKRFADEIAEMEALYNEHVAPELIRRQHHRGGAKRSEAYMAALYKDFDGLKDKLQAGNSAGMIHYKELLKEIRTGLDFDVKLFEKSGLNAGTYYFYEHIPYLTAERSYNLYPNYEAHSAIVKAFRAADEGAEFAERINELDELHHQHVAPALEARKSNHIPGIKAAAVERSGEKVAQAEGKTALSKYILQRMRESEFNISNLGIHTHGSPDSTLNKLFTRLDEPAANDAAVDYGTAARWLGEIMDYPPFAFTENEKQTMRGLFNLNCWNSVLKDGSLADKDAIEAYKTTLNVLLLQSGLGLEKAGMMLGGICKQAVDQYLITDKSLRYGFILPSAERHREFCDDLKEFAGEGLVNVDLDDLAEFDRLHQAAHVESRRHNSLRGRQSNTDEMSPLGRTITEILRERNISPKEVADSLCVSYYGMETMLKSKTPGAANKIAEILCRRDRAVDMDDQTPTYEPGTDDGINVKLLKQNSATAGVETAGKSYIPGFSGLSHSDKIKLGTAQIEEILQAARR